MFVAFIDFKNTYDRMNQNKLWDCLVGIGFKGTVVDVFRAVCIELKREVIVKVGEMVIVSQSFSVVNGLRQGCVLSPVLFLLYISSLLDKLGGAEVRIRCKDQLIPTLLYTDDMVIFVAN